MVCIPCTYNHFVLHHSFFFFGLLFTTEEKNIVCRIYRFVQRGHHISNNFLFARYKSPINMEHIDQHVATRDEQSNFMEWERDLIRRERQLHETERRLWKWERSMMKWNVRNQQQWNVGEEVGPPWHDFAGWTVFE